MNEKIKLNDIVRLLDKENYGKLAVVIEIDKWDVLGTDVVAYTVIGYKSGSVSYNLCYDGEQVPSLIYLDGQFEKY